MNNLCRSLRSLLVRWLHYLAVIFNLTGITIIIYEAAIIRKTLILGQIISRVRIGVDLTVIANETPIADPIIEFLLLGPVILIQLLSLLIQLLSCLLLAKAIWKLGWLKIRLLLVFGVLL